MLRRRQPPDDSPSLAGHILLDALAALVDLHLVEPHDCEPEEARFGMLVSIREFGREALADAAEDGTLRTRHARYYATLVDEAAVALESRVARTWARRVEGELVDVRAALSHFLEAGSTLDGLRMATGAGRFWLNQGHMAEGRQWLSAFLGQVELDELPVRERASALLWTARLEMDDLVSGESSASSPVLARLEQARVLAGSIQDEQLELAAMLFLTAIVRPDDDVERGLSLAEEGIARARLVSRWRLAELLHTGSLLAHWAGHRERAAALAADVVRARR